VDARVRYLMTFIETNLMEICISYLKENFQKQIQVSRYLYFIYV